MHFFVLPHPSRFQVILGFTRQVKNCPKKIVTHIFLNVHNVQCVPYFQKRPIREVPKRRDVCPTHLFFPGIIGTPEPWMQGLYGISFLETWTSDYFPVNFTTRRWGL